MSFHILSSRKSKKVRSGARSLCLLIPGVVVLAASLANASITYTQDTNVHDFTSTVNQYAEFITGSGSPYTPTSADLESGSPKRVIGKDAGIVVDFGVGAAVSKILIFNNIDHIGYAWDAFQPYRIYGSNDNVNFTQLSDALTASPADHGGVDQHFMLDSWRGTPPVFINNTVSSNGIGYETYFDFTATGSFRYYKFVYSTLTQNNINSNEWEEELSGIAEASAPAPEPSSMALIGSGLLTLGGLVRQRLIG